MIDQARQVDDESAEDRAHEQSWPEVVYLARVNARPGRSVVHPARTVSANVVLANDDGTKVVTNAGARDMTT